MIYRSMNEDKFNSNAKSIIHDVNNLLSNILKSAEFIRSDSKNLNDYIEIIISNSLTSARLLENILHPSDLNLKPTSLDQICKGVLSEFRLVTKKNIDFKFVAAENSSVVNVDDFQIRRVVHNLILNAVESIENSGRIIVKISSPREGETMLEITDTGVGISESEIKNIFKTGFTTKSVSGNSGLGLSHSREILKKHRAELSCKSVKNVGTTFTIIFTLNDSKIQAASDKKILLAEDDPTLNSLLTDTFFDYGFEIDSVSDGSKILEKLYSSKNYSLLILDNKMPGKNGITLIKEIRENKIKIPIILMTGASTEEFESEANLDFHLIKKPFRTEELMEIIQNKS